MKQQLRLRLDGLSAQDWEGEFLERLAQDQHLSSTEILPEKPTRDPGSAAVIDPGVMVALITGSSAIVAALIPVLVDVFRGRSSETPAQVFVVLHGAANSSSFAPDKNDISEASIERYIKQIGPITGIEIRK